MNFFSTKINRPNKGYTIIETMIAISIFIVIVMAGMGALLNANFVHNKSADMRSIMDNLSFIMEDMSRNLRTGYDYKCLANGTTPNAATVSSIPVTSSCADSGGGIIFEQQNGVREDPEVPGNENTGDQWVYYVGPNSSGTKSRLFRSTDGANSFIALTPDEVDITFGSFVVSGAEPPPNARQPFVQINLVGEIMYKGTPTPFSLQTSVSQRRLDI